MRILHLIKTTSGADWACRQIKQLVQLGLDIHVALPQGPSIELEKWQSSGANLHWVDLDLPIHSPFQFRQRIIAARALVEKVRPDLIHSHFFGTTLMIRYALGKTHPIPRIFQVPGPLHLENKVFRTWELSSSGSADFWIGSSLYIQQLYLKSGIDSRRISKSYYGVDIPLSTALRSHALHSLLSIPKDQRIIGNVSYIYKPKYYLGHLCGVKRHEDLIDAIAAVVKQRPEVTGVIIGGAWKGAENYEKKLRKRADLASGGKIIMTGAIQSKSISRLWPDFDLAIHVPSSENCGGVVEPLLAGVPVIASAVGGLPEIIREGDTGRLVQPKDSKKLATVILQELDHPAEARARAERGKVLVRSQFDVIDTAQEVRRIYKEIVSLREEKLRFL